MPSPPKQSQEWLNDLELARAATKGDSKALAQFAERMRCVPRFLAALNAQKGRPLAREDLADVSQDTLVAIWQKLETFQGHATLETWSRRFCQFEFSNRVRSQYRRKATVAAAARDALYDPQAGIVVPTPPPSDHSALETRLQALDATTENIIRMKHFEMLIFDEIASRMNLAPSTVKSRYYRGLLSLKNQLDGSEHTS